MQLQMMKNNSILKGATKGKKAPQTNLEIINNLKHTLSKPTIVDAQRTLKIMDKLIENLGIFLYLDTDFVMKFNDISNPQKTKLNKTLVQQLSAQTLDLFVKEAKLQSQLRPFGNIEQQLRDGQTVQQQRIQQYERIKIDLANNFRTLIRVLSKNKNDQQIVLNLRNNSIPNADVQFVQQALGNYKIIMQKKLATAAEEQQVHTRVLQQLKQKIKSLQKSRLNCEQELQRLRTQRARHTQQKKEQIDKLRSEIRQVQNNKQKDLNRINDQTKKVKQALEKQRQQRQQKLNTQINAERTKLNKLKEQNLKQETALKTKKAGGEGTLQQNIGIYDRQMQAQHKVKSELQRQLKRLSDELNNFRKHFQQIQMQRQRQQALMEEHRKRKEMYDLIQKRKGQAATRIKAAWKLWKKKSKKNKKKKPIKKK